MTVSRLIELFDRNCERDIQIGRHVAFIAEKELAVSAENQEKYEQS